VIYLSCAIGTIGLAIFAVAPSVPVALVGAAFYGAAGGTFLAVDWALMTDIIPKASSGRYMGISNVATGSSGLLATAIGGALIMDPVNRLYGLGTGGRAAMAFGAACYVLGAGVLRFVVEPRRQGTGSPDTSRPVAGSSPPERRPAA